MQRTVTAPAELSDEPLADLKEWLSITRSGEDALLIDLLAASLALCEAFTGQTPVEQTVEEQFEPSMGDYPLRSLPIRSLVSVELVDENGSRAALAASEYEVRIEASSTASLILHEKQIGRSVAVTVRAGVAGDWASLPPPLKQGVIRLAAFQYRDRDARGAAAPPSSVAALWQPWRALRVA